MMDILDRIINMLCIWDIELRMLYCDTKKKNWNTTLTYNETMAH